MDRIIEILFVPIVTGVISAATVHYFVAGGKAIPTNRSAAPVFVGLPTLPGPARLAAVLGAAFVANGSASWIAHIIRGTPNVGREFVVGGVWALGFAALWAGLAMVIVLFTDLPNQKGRWDYETALGAAVFGGIAFSVCGTIGWHLGQCEPVVECTEALYRIELRGLGHLARGGLFDGLGVAFPAGYIFLRTPPKGPVGVIYRHRDYILILGLFLLLVVVLIHSTLRADSFFAHASGYQEVSIIWGAYWFPWVVGFSFATHGLEHVLRWPLFGPSPAQSTDGTDTSSPGDQDEDDTKAPIEAT